MSIGFALPFAVSTGSLGYFEMSDSPVAAARNDALSLLVTNWGERPMNYYMGCNLVEFLFEPRNIELKEKISARIEEQFSRWLPSLLLVTVDVIFPEEDPQLDPSEIKVKMSFDLPTRERRGLASSSGERELRGDATIEHTLGGQ